MNPDQAISYALEAMEEHTKRDAPLDRVRCSHEDTPLPGGACAGARSARPPSAREELPRRGERPHCRAAR